MGGVYEQTGAAEAPATPVGASGNYLAEIDAIEQNSGDFTTASITYPGANSPLSAPFEACNGNSDIMCHVPIGLAAATSTYNLTGAGSAFSIQTFSSLSALTTAFPTGVYTATATNSQTGASQSASIDYAPGVFSTVPTLTPSSYNQLQGMNPAAPFQMNFVTPFNSSSPNSTVQLYFLGGGGGGLITIQPTAPLVIQPNTFLPNTSYEAIVSFINAQTSVVSGVTEEWGFLQSTGVTFTTGSATPVQTVTVPGGTTTHPTELSGTGVAEVSGTIGGVGSAQFYGFSWAGGAFTVDASVTGADANGSYDLILYGPSGEVAEVVLDSADSFMATIDLSALAAGDYSIGLEANSANDPSFTLVFDTPVDGTSSAVPEPSTWAMLMTGLGVLGLAARRRARARASAA